MTYQDSVFNQLLKVIPGYQLDRLIKKHRGDYRVRKLGCREQLIALLYGQLTGRKSLRDLELSFNSHSQHFYHLGCGSEIKRSTLADANNNRPVELFEELFQWLVARGLSGKKRREASTCIRLLDASTVVLNKQRFGWAIGHKDKSGIKLHTVYDLDAEIPTYFELTPARNSDLSTAKELTFEAGRYYVFDRGYYDFSFWRDLDQQGCRFLTRLKKNSPTQIEHIKPLPSGVHTIISDHEVRLSKRMSKSRVNPYQKRLREVVVQVEPTAEPIRLITNDFDSDARDIAALYKKRWQIELFFKWVKQNLKIKTFLGTSENAVKIQILVAMIAFILLKLVSNTFSIKGLSLLTISRLVETNIMRRVAMIDILAPPPYGQTPLDQNPLQERLCF